jgi:hypothetical protein
MIYGLCALAKPMITRAITSFTKSPYPHPMSRASSESRISIQILKREDFGRKVLCATIDPDIAGTLAVARLASTL